MIAGMDDFIVDDALGDGDGDRMDVDEAAAALEAEVD